MTTRYGGGFVQSIDGVEGSARRHEDWFWFVNGLAGDRSAASYRLRDGDVAWWDYRDWSGDAETLEVVAGAFPEPFLHGYDGKVRPVAVRYGPGLRPGAERIARVLRDRRRRPGGHGNRRERQRLRARGGRAQPDGGPAVARRRGLRVRCGSRSPARSMRCSQATSREGSRSRERRLRQPPSSPPWQRRPSWSTASGPSTAMTLVLLVICLRAPVERRWLYIGGVLLSALGVIVISPLTWSSGGGTLLWEGPITARSRPDRHLDGRDPDRGRQRPSAGGRRPGLQRLHASRRPRPTRLGSGLCPAVGPRSRPRHPPRPEPRTRRGGARRFGAGDAASSCTGHAGTRCCSRRSSPGRSSGRPAWPRRWRREGSGETARHGRLAPPGRGSTTWRSSARWHSSGSRSCGCSDRRRPVVSRTPAALRPSGTSRSSSRTVRSSRCSARPGAASRRCCGRSPAWSRISTGDGSRVGSRLAGSTHARTAPPSSPAASRRSSRIPRTRS